MPGDQPSKVLGIAKSQACCRAPVIQETGALPLKQPQKNPQLILPTLQRRLSPPHTGASAAGGAFNKLWFQHEVCICLLSPALPAPSTKALLCASAGAESDTQPEAAAFPCLHSLLLFCYYYLAYK